MFERQVDLGPPFKGSGFPKPLTSLTPSSAEDIPNGLKGAAAVPLAGPQACFGAFS